MSHSSESQKHADRVLEAMRKAMKDVPEENSMAVVSILYLTIGKRYHREEK